MSLEDVPASFAEYFGINEGTAQVILSIVIIFTILLPTMLLARGKNATLIYLVMRLLAELLLVGLGWMSFWVLITTLSMMALGVAVLGTDAVIGE